MKAPPPDDEQLAREVEEARLMRELWEADDAFAYFMGLTDEERWRVVFDFIRDESRSK